MAIVEHQYRLSFAVLFACFTLFGTSMTILGAALPRILSDFNWAYTVAGAVIAAGAVGYFVGAFIAGALADRIHLRAVLLGGLALEVLGLSLFAAVPAPLVNLGLNLIIGFGQGCIEVGVNASVLRMDRSGTGRAMNVMHASFAIGAVAGPVAIGVLGSVGLGWTVVFRALACLSVLLAVAALLVPLGAAGRPEARSQGGPSLARQSAYWLGFVALFLYVGVELGVSNWIAEYFVKVFGLGAAAASFAVSVFWAGLLAGRLGVPAVYRGSRRGLVLVAFAVLTMTSVTLLWLLSYIPSGGAAGAGSGLLLLAGAAAFLSGLGCSIIYPTVITLVGGAFPASQGAAIGFAATGGGIGAFVFPFLMSAIAQAAGVRAGFAAYAAFSLLTAASCIALVRIVGARRAKTGGAAVDGG